MRANGAARATAEGMTDGETARFCGTLEVADEDEAEVDEDSAVVVSAVPSATMMVSPVVTPREVSVAEGEAAGSRGSGGNPHRTVAQGKGIGCVLNKSRADDVRSCLVL